MAESRDGCGNGDNRRAFLKKAAAAGGAAVAASNGAVPAWAQQASRPAIPTVTLGRTGQKVTILGMGTSWRSPRASCSRRFIIGVRYIDTSQTYEGGNAERVIGEVLERTKMRKEVYLVTKNARRKIGGPGAYKAYLAQLEASLERLKTDYVDCYYLHGVEGREIAVLRDPDCKAAFEKLKKSGKIRFCGLSCHDGMLPEILEAAAEVGFIRPGHVQIQLPRHRP